MVRKALSTHGEGCCNTLKDCSTLVYAVHYIYKQGSSLCRAQATFVVRDTGIENSDKGKSLVPCGNLLPLPTHPYALIAVFTAHRTAERKFPLGVDCPKVQSNLTEAFLPYILASLKCTLLDKVKTNFPFVCSLTVHIAIREKGGFRSRDAGRSGGAFQTEEREISLFKPLNA